MNQGVMEGRSRWEGTEGASEVNRDEKTAEEKGELSMRRKERE